jgi:uncharacterized protein (DUF427 family)|tara:strand:- start:123 stop:590 length:468 start_codon:yes stop_codon:yes gene_type:complete
MQKESVWDYPRPPRLEFCSEEIEIIFGDIIAKTDNSYRVLETSHPPTFYLPRLAFKEDILIPIHSKTLCEWKGKAEYFDIKSTDGRISKKAAWSYNSPSDDFIKIKGYVAIYPNSVDSCLLNNEEVKSQDGDFYGGWITSDIIGPFKGGVGSFGW